MRILISGICGFAGSTIARGLAALGKGYEISGFDNFIRPGSESNRDALKALGVKVFHGDVRTQSDVDAFATTNWVIDAAANPSVLAGTDGKSSSRQAVEHNLCGTLNLLEYCKRAGAGFTLLSTSRVYSIPPLASLTMRVVDEAFVPEAQALPTGISGLGVGESFSTSAPISLYGATKLGSEALALEYGHAFGLPVFINRCGVLAGAGQFGRPDQGIFSYWINSHLRRRPLRYIGFGGTGHQVRDCLHPTDLLPVLTAQMAAPTIEMGDRIANFSGGIASAISLRQLNNWCDDRFGKHPVAADPAPRAFDIPWMVLDSAKGLTDLELEAPDSDAGDSRGDRSPCGDQSWVAGVVGTARMSLTLFSVVIPARDEAESLPPTLRGIYAEFLKENVPHEIVVVDDGSRDNSWSVLQALVAEIPTLVPIRNNGDNGFGRAVVYGLGQMKGDAVVIMMADASDLPADAVKYWRLLCEGNECVFGSRFMKGGVVVDYPGIKLFVNRLANLFIRVMFAIPLNDTTNAFKAYRRTVIDGCRPFMAPHFNLTVELPLKAIVRGYTWTVIPISWYNRKYGTAKLKIKEMGSRYFFICMYVWLEKYFSRGDYRRH